MSTFSRHVSWRRAIAYAFILIVAVSVLLFSISKVSSSSLLVFDYSSKQNSLETSDENSYESAKDQPVVESQIEVVEVLNRTQEKQTTDVVDNKGASSYLNKYRRLFNEKEERVLLKVDPNVPEAINKWWQAAAMIDWYINSPIRYECKGLVTMGNWHICQDTPYTIQSPCLVYSFGLPHIPSVLMKVDWGPPGGCAMLGFICVLLTTTEITSIPHLISQTAKKNSLFPGRATRKPRINWDFSFDDDMVALGCEVHSFDPSMNEKDHDRVNGSTFHNLGLGMTNTDAYIPRQDIYVKDKQLWKLRTVKAIMKELGHENRVIDVFKMDVEGYEWGVIDNMMETGVFKYIRQYMLEFHLFPTFPAKEDYVNSYKILTRLREMGFREFHVGPHSKTLNVKHFNNQGDSEYVNVFFERESTWR